jgi:glycine oxidase
VSTTTTDVAVVGGGVIGLAVAWRLARSELRVSVIDPAPAAAASRAAAGMLAPVSEVRYGETELLRFAMESLRRYPGLVADLEAATGHVLGLRGEGTLIAATDAGDREMLIELHRFQTELGLDATMLGAAAVRDIEPMVSPDVRCGLLVRSDHSIDNRRLTAALLAALDGPAVELVHRRVASVTVEHGRATGVLLDNGDTVGAGAVVVAAGPWSGELDGVPQQAIPVRPVKGQILRLQARQPRLLPGCSIRGLVNGREIYLVPRTDGELVVGATVEEVGFDTTVRAGAVREMLRDARAVMPSVDELELVEACAALRPGSPDNAPIIGDTGVEGLTVATGHHRNGILLTPLTADLVAAIVTDTASEEDRRWLAVAAPGRFASASAAR